MRRSYRSSRLSKGAQLRHFRRPVNMYAFLLCILHVHFVFSGALPVDKKDEVSSDSGGINYLTWSNSVDEKGICKLNGTLLLDCNSCMCEAGRPPACTLMACPPKYEGTNKRCKPGDRWKEDCNKCICSESGLAHCTIMDCASRKRMKRYFGLEPEHGKGTQCAPGTNWKVDCNSCVCTEKGVPECTFKACIKWERITEKNDLPQEIKDIVNEDGKCRSSTDMVKVSCNTCFCSDDGELYCTQKHCSKKDHRKKRSPTSKIPQGGKCKPGDKWKLDECNNCVCTHTGFASCSLNECPSNNKQTQRPKRSPVESGKVPAGGKCKPGDKWKLDECNNCVCTHTGFASCTLNECPSSIERPRRSPVESGNIPPGGKCKPGDKWKLDECNDCVCTHTGFASCTLNECSSNNKKTQRPKRSPAESGHIPPGGKCKPGDKWKLDECNDCVCTHTGFASCTLNECSSNNKKQTQRPKRSPAEPGKIPPGGKCKPGDKWKLDECNNCVCTHTGFASCSLNECPSNNKQTQRPKRSPAESGNIPPGGKCKPGDKWKLDECNDCVCTHTGFASCTLNECTSNNKKTQRPKRSPVESGHIPPGGKCKPGDKWKLDECNECICTHTGFASCTLNECSSNKKQTQRPKRSPAEPGKIPPGGKCKPGDKWKLDECNNCVCTHTGFASCTLNECPSNNKPTQRPKRSPAESDKIPQAGKCKPGDRWKTDECNICICTHTGFASCSLNECTSNNKRQKRSPVESGKVPPGGKCKPGDRWKLDECNDCVCTHTGFASCTLNECPDKKTRGKRSSDGSQLSDFLDENGICKETVSFKLDCNTCFCRKGATAGCTLAGCHEYKNETHKLEQEEPQSESSLSEFVDEHGKCKQKVAFQLDCNSCYCSEPGRLPRCTLKACPEYKNKTQRLARDARKENGNSGRECKPGATWKENCNSCFCSERGVAMCTDIPTCPSPAPGPQKEGVPGSSTTKSALLSSTTPASQVSTDLISTTESTESSTYSEISSSTETAETTTITSELISTTQIE